MQKVLIYCYSNSNDKESFFYQENYLRKECEQRNWEIIDIVYGTVPAEEYYKGIDFNQKFDYFLIPNNPRAISKTLKFFDFENKIENFGAKIITIDNISNDHKKEKGFGYIHANFVKGENALSQYMQDQKNLIQDYANQNNISLTDRVIWNPRENFFQYFKSSDIYNQLQGCKYLIVSDMEVISNNILEFLEIEKKLKQDFNIDIIIVNKNTDIIHPGKTLEAILRLKKLSSEDFSKGTGISLQKINDFIGEKVKVDQELIEGIENYLNYKGTNWENLQKNYENNFDIFSGEMLSIYRKVGCDLRNKILERFEEYPKTKKLIQKLFYDGFIVGYENKIFVIKNMYNKEIKKIKIYIEDSNPENDGAICTEILSSLKVKFGYNYKFND